MERPNKVCRITLRCGVLTCRRPRGNPLQMRGSAEIDKIAKKYNLELKEGVSIYYEYKWNESDGVYDFIKPATQNDYVMQNR